MYCEGVLVHLISYTLIQHLSEVHYRKEQASLHWAHKVQEVRYKRQIRVSFYMLLAQWKVCFGSKSLGKR